MRVVVGVDLGSTTTKAVLLDEQRRIVGRGITNSRSNYEVACAVAREEALTAARFTMLERELERRAAVLGGKPSEREYALREAFRLEIYLDQLGELHEEMEKVLKSLSFISDRSKLSPAIGDVVSSMKGEAPALFGEKAGRRSDFFRDLAAASYMSTAERVAAASKGTVSYERLTGVFDRAILDVETKLQSRDFGTILRRAAHRLGGAA